MRKEGIEIRNGGWRGGLLLVVVYIQDAKGFSKVGKGLCLKGILESGFGKRVNPLFVCGWL